MAENLWKQHSLLRLFNSIIIFMNILLTESYCQMALHTQDSYRASSDKTLSWYFIFLIVILQNEQALWKPHHSLLCLLLSSFLCHHHFSKPQASSSHWWARLAGSSKATSSGRKIKEASEAVFVASSAHQRCHLKLSEHQMKNKKALFIAHKKYWQQRITELLLIEKNFHVHQVQPLANLTKAGAKPYVLQAPHLYPVKHLQRWWFNHHPRKPLPVFESPFNEVSSKIQFKPPLVHLELISSFPKEEMSISWVKKGGSLPGASNP